jgi:6-phosphogluconolactonase (cycloisomerase 2 family)
MKLATFVLTFGLFAGTGFAQTYHVFTMSNTSPNEVLMYTRGSGGSLSLTTTAATGGNGTNVFLASQGALAVEEKALFAVNSKSDSISVLNISGSTLKLVGTVSSNGTQPVSLTYSNGVLYVLNSGGTGSISGFTFNKTTGSLTLIAGSTQPLSGMPNSGGAQISFTKNGAYLIVTEKNTNIIDVYKVTAGVAGPPTSYSSNAPTPYGFATGLNNRFYLSEANGSVVNGSSVSSYSLPGGVPHIISASVPTDQYAACWVSLNAANTVAYVTDAMSAAVSVFSIDSTGHLALIQTVITPEPPFDNAVSGDGLYYYQLTATATNHQIVPYSIGANGILTQLPAVNGSGSAIGLVTVTN